MRVRIAARLLFSLVLLLSLNGCGSSTRSSVAADADASAAASARGADWPTYQQSPSRAGVAVGAPAFSGFHRRFTRKLDGQVYAQPLIYRGRIYVATENNSVYAFSRTGRRLFRRHFGPPVPGGDLPCGNIDPSGITGTPVIAANRLFAVAFLRAGHRHVLYALNLRNGRVDWSRRVDPAAGALVEQQRGALLADHGRVYVPYGGLYGDCGDYHGYVVSTTTSGGGRRVYANPSPEAGIWAPGGISEESDGTLLVATGNGLGNSFGYSDSVIRLSPNLRRLDYWAPRDWLELSNTDTDLGSISPAPLPGGYVFESGKNGVGYLLRHSLGGIGGEAFQAPICGGAYGAAAVSPPYVIVPCNDSLVALNVNGDRFSTEWKVDGAAGTPIVAGGAVIYATPGGGVRALRLSDGRQLASVDQATGTTSFPAIAASGDRLVVPGGDSIVVYSGI